MFMMFGFKFGSARFARVIAFICLSFLVATPVLAQGAAQTTTGERGRLTGVVIDAAGGSVPDAIVSLVGSGGVVAGVVESDAQGRYVLDAVPPGAYVLHATKAAFADARQAIVIEAGVTISADVRLEVSELAAEVTVTAEAGNAADARRIDQAVNVIGDDQIAGRAPEVIAQVADEEPGVNLQRTSPSLSGIFVRGLTGRNVAIYLDGVRFTTSTQRGGINTFLNLNEQTNLAAVEIVRGAATSQYGSDALGGVVHFVPRDPVFGDKDHELHGDASVYFTSPTTGFGGNTLLTYGTRRFGVLLNTSARRINTLRPGGGIDTHSALTRFLGLPSNISGERLPDTAFTQYGGLLRANFATTDTSQLILSYTRSQQDGGKRYDQLLGGDGNLRADLRNLMLDFFVARFAKQDLGFFDSGTFAFSYNGQREERTNQGGQGDPLAAITSQRERTNAAGFSFSIDKIINRRHTLLFGSEIYHDRVNTYSLTTRPAANTTTRTRPRVPDRARYLSYGFFAQHVAEVIPERLRVSGALRYSVASYRSRAADAPVGGNGRPLFPDDAQRFAAFSGRIGGVLTIRGGFDVAAKYARGFRAPNTTDLSTLGLVGSGYEVDARTAAARGGFVGMSASRDAVSSGTPVPARLTPETSHNFDLSFRFRRPRFSAELTGFTNKIDGVFAEQALILPPGATGTFLGDQRIANQLANGVVFVEAATNPVLVRTNYGDVRLNGVEFESEARLGEEVTVGGNFTLIRAADVRTGLPPNIEGGTPPATGFVRLRYQPSGLSRFYVEAYSTLSARQTRLSSLDLEDRRTGALRTRAQIANFFDRGARVRGFIGNGADGVARTADDVLTRTSETVTQVQNRVLGSASAAPLFSVVPGYGLIGLRGVYRFGDKSEIFVDFENITDKSYRGISWGVDGAGRGVTLRYRYRF